MMIEPKTPLGVLGGLAVKKNLVVAVSLFVAGLGAGACSVDRAPTGLRMTPPGTGPKVEWDLTHRPLPQVPLPNDIATFPDPTSRTGLRINASLVAPTNIERVARSAFDEMEGWGTSAPLSVQFQRDDSMVNGEAVIDLLDVKSRMSGHDYDMTDDVVYLVNLTTGVPVILDMGNGNFPVTIRDLDRYWPNDPHYDLARGRVSQNLLFETLEEGRGLGQRDYAPQLDMDFDGVLDHPNTLGAPSRPDLDGVDNLISWYERETDTLILRPLIPMHEKTEYAVVLTDRLRGSNGQPIRSPFDAIHHPMQRPGVAQLQAILSDPRRKNYYGNLAGSGLDHVAFAWTFTTMPVQEDMKLLRDGLYGKGPFAHFADRYPPKMSISRAAGLALTAADEPPDLTSTPACKERMKTPYIVKPNDPDVAVGIHQYYEKVVGTAPGETKWVNAANAFIDHIVIGTFDSPYLQGDPKDLDPEEARFHVNFKTGEGDVQTDKVHFWLIVPKPSATAKPPFNVSFWEHGVTGNDSETMIYAGALAAQGIATIGIDMPEHGLSYGAGDYAAAQTALRPPCLVEWVTATGTGRDRAYSRNGTGRSGWFWWTSHVFHVRDNVRQGLLDMMNTVRILRSFDGARKADEDYNGDGQLNDLAGDFDGDGAVDLGGPNAKYFSAGESLGGMMSEGIGGVEPALTATTPMSGGAGMGDIGARSFGVTEAVWEQILGPIVTSTPASLYPNDSKGKKATSCAPDQRSIRFHVNDGDESVDIEIACLTAAEVDVGMTVVVENVKSKEMRCARTDKDGRFRVSFPTSIGDPIDIQLYTKPDVVKSYKGCEITLDAVPGRRINTFEVAAFETKQVGDETKKCPDDATSGCAQFRDTFFPVGSKLVAPNEGYGDQRNTPELRRLFQLVQAALDPADNFNFAPYYMIRPLLDENGNVAPPRALLSINTVGDMFVPVSTGSAFARAAGALPFLPPAAADKMPEYAEYATPPELYAAFGNKTPNQLMIENHAIDGIARFGYTSAGPACKANYVSVQPSGMTCDRMQSPPSCANALWDADWTSEGKQGFDQPHAQVPLRLARYAELHPTSAASLSAAWEPRIVGVPVTGVDGAWKPSKRVVAMVNHYIVPEGNHTWDIGDVCRKWDQASYGDALIARFFASGGTDVYYLSHPQTHATCLVGTPDHPFEGCDVFK